MQKFKYLLYLLSAVILTGCGQTVIETLKVADPPDPYARGNGRTMIILPFADYTEADDLAGAYRRNLAVTEALTDNLVKNGFGMAVQEDVFGYLADEEIINVEAYGRGMSQSLSFELTKEWSDSMKQVLRGYAQQQKHSSMQNVSDAPGTHAIDQKAIAKMGREFNADYVMRGRILEFKTRQEATWEPWKRGLLPFIFSGTSRVFNGFASSDAYDARNEALAGALYGGVIGFNNATFPWDGGSSILGMVDGSTNAIFWAATGGALGMVANNSGRVDQAVVQMRVWVQEASSGQVVWTNRIRVQVSPESVFADNQYDTLFNQAIDKGVASLVDHFVANGLF
jgi:hypothetical protein